MVENALEHPDNNVSNQSKQSKFIFITGGVLSSLGKGLVSASIGCILKELGYSVNMKKMDPYLNVDPGTMNPMQHGEVFVTNDGTEADLDLGNYERFTNITTSRSSTTTSGRIYQTLLERERRGVYLGKTVQIIPHITGIIKEFLVKDYEKHDFTIVEVGGTVGDLESQPFLEAIRQLATDIGRRNVMFIHLSYIPYLGQTDEIKTKPTQHSIRKLMEAGIMADAIMCRTKARMGVRDKEKIATFCNVHTEEVIEAPDVDNIYTLPSIYAKQGLAQCIMTHFKIDDVKLDDEKLTEWGNYGKKIAGFKQEVNVCVVGKYNNANDCYKSLYEAIQHAGYANEVRTKVKWVDSRKATKETIKEQLADADCVIIPGGFGVDGCEGKIEAITYCRENDIPLLGICLGMQLSVIEFMRNVVGVKSANSTEFEPECKDPVVCLMKGWQAKNGKIEKRDENADMGGTLRLGAYTSQILPGTLAEKVYQSNEIVERHRHRYEINAEYIETIEKHGGKFSAFAKTNSKELKIPEMFEIPSKRFFISCQYHPEFLSRPFAPHPLFRDLIKSAKEGKKQ